MKGYDAGELIYQKRGGHTLGSVLRTDHIGSIKRARFDIPTGLAILILVLVFSIDMVIPLGIAIGILYLFSFILVCNKERKVIVTFAVVTSSLTLIKLLVFLSPVTTVAAIANRGLTIVVIAIMAMLAIRHRALIDRLNVERSDYITELESMLTQTSHRVRKPIATCQGLLELMDKDKSLSPEEIKHIIEHMKSNIAELDLFTKDLTHFIHEAKQREINKSGAGIQM